MTDRSLRHRFPGVRDGWARFDGPAGTQMVDVAIHAMTEWASSGRNANTEGAFTGADECDALLERARATVGQLLGADPAGVCFGANMTTMTMALTRAVEQTLRPGDRIVGTRLDHDANVTPWRIACERSGAEHVLAGFDPATGRLDPQAVIDLIDDRTRWVTLPGASNLIGTTPDLGPIVDAAHAVGARVFVDAVHLAPHRAELSPAWRRDPDRALPRSQRRNRNWRMTDERRKRGEHHEQERVSAEVRACRKLLVGERYEFIEDRPQP